MFRLGGITVLQAYTYFPRPSDRPLIQVIVSKSSCSILRVPQLLTGGFHGVCVAGTITHTDVYHTYRIFDFVSSALVVQSVYYYLVLRLRRPGGNSR